jgi:hypothetical protein
MIKMLLLLLMMKYITEETLGYKQPSHFGYTFAFVVIKGR